MKTKKIKRFLRNPFALVIGALVLFGGSFAMASGEIPGMASLAAATAAVTGKPTVIVSRDSSSPSGIIDMGKSQKLAVYKVTTKNLSNGNLNGISGQLSVTFSQNALLYVDNIYLQYTYCQPSYGGGTGEGTTCSQSPAVQASNSAASATSANRITVPQYILNFNLIAPLTPGSPTYITVYGTPRYASTGNLTKSASDANLQVQLFDISGSGNQCKSTKYGYSCTWVNFNANITNNGYKLKIPRPYGYGYKGPLSSLR